MLTKGEITATRMYYDSTEQRYYVSNLADMEGKEGEAVRKTVVEDVGRYHSFLVERATQCPNTWVGPTLGDGECGDALVNSVQRFEHYINSTTIHFV